MDLLKILNDFLLSNEDLDNTAIFDNIEDIDLTDDEQYKLLVNKINALRNNELFQLFGEVFGIDDEFYDKLLKDLETYRNQLLVKNVPAKSDYKKIDTSSYNNINNKKINNQQIQQPEIDRPSQHINTQAGLQIHKLVQEYVDTMIKPYNHNQLTQQQINDAYAGLYEFACWIFNK